NDRPTLAGIERAAQLRGRVVAQERDPVNVALVHVQTLDGPNARALARERQVRIVVVRLESDLIGRPRPGDNQLDHAFSLKRPLKSILVLHDLRKPTGSKLKPAV